ncbi:MAG: hypothetical protein QM535_19240 [Limnohabitans sp.]|nr:hypothetical protein [Limnohabitans sp.]
MKLTILGNSRSGKTFYFRSLKRFTKYRVGCSEHSHSIELKNLEDQKTKDYFFGELDDTSTQITSVLDIIYQEGINNLLDIHFVDTVGQRQSPDIDITNEKYREDLNNIRNEVAESDAIILLVQGPINNKVKFQDYPGSNELMSLKLVCRLLFENLAKKKKTIPIALCISQIDSYIPNTTKEKIKGIYNRKDDAIQGRCDAIKDKCREINTELSNLLFPNGDNSIKELISQFYATFSGKNTILRVFPCSSFGLDYIQEPQGDKYPKIMPLDRIWGNMAAFLWLICIHVQKNMPTPHAVLFPIDRLKSVLREVYACESFYDNDIPIFSKEFILLLETVPFKLSDFPKR